MHHDESAASKQAERAPLQTQFPRLQTQNARSPNFIILYPEATRKKRQDENSLLPSKKNLSLRCPKPSLGWAIKADNVVKLSGDSLEITFWRGKKAPRSYILSSPKKTMEFYGHIDV
jgi:hypothetical protein